MNRIEILREFLEATPGDNFLQHALALEYIKAGRDDEARSLFEAVLERDPGYVGTYYHLALLHVRNNRIPEANLIYEKGMEEAKKAGDDHAYAELRSAYEDLNF
jgi:Tfp pilus assembly protein PilF